MINAGAMMEKFHNNPNSARAILERLYQLPPRKLLVQQTMVDSGLPFEHTKVYLSMNAFNFVDELLRLYSEGQLSVDTVASTIKIWLDPAMKAVPRDLNFYVNMLLIACRGIGGTTHKMVSDIGIRAIYAYFGESYMNEKSEL